MKLKTLDFDVIVIGCGIAGMNAPIYLKRANLKVCIIEKMSLFRIYNYKKIL